MTGAGDLEQLLGELAERHVHVLGMRVSADTKVGPGCLQDHASQISTLAGELDILLPYLKTCLAQDRFARAKSFWIAGETAYEKEDGR